MWKAPDFSLERLVLVFSSYIIFLTINTKLQDYIPTVNAQGTIVTGTEGNLDFVIRIGELKGGKNMSGDLRFTIIKNTNLSLTFEPTKVMQQSQMIHNVMWKLEETDALYIFTFKGEASTIFMPNTISKIGLTAKYISPSSMKGKFDLDITIVGGTGEENLGNNKDNEIVEYNNIES